MWKVVVYKKWYKHAVEELFNGLLMVVIVYWKNFDSIKNYAQQFKHLSPVYISQNFGF